MSGNQACSPFDKSTGFNELNSDGGEENHKEWKTIVPQQIKLGTIKKLQKTTQSFVKAGIPRKSASN